MRILIIAGCLALTGCISMPRQTAELNVILGGQIADSKRMTLEVVDAWAEQSRGRVETLLHYHIVPQFIIKFLNDPEVKADFAKIACGDRGIMDRAFVVRDIVEAISKQIEKTRGELLGGIEFERQALVDAANQHYAEMDRMYRAITANINSVVNGQEFEAQIRAVLAKPIKDVVPLDKAKERMDKLLGTYTNEE